MAQDALVIISPGFAANEEDTTCMPYVQMFVKALRVTYPLLKIHIISFQYPFIASGYNWYGCTVHAIAGRNKKWNRLFTWQKARKQFEEIYAENRVIGIFSLWLTECTFIAQKLAGKHKLKTVAWVLGQDVKPSNKYISRLDFSMFDVACVSPFSAQQLQLNHGIKSKLLIGNGLYLQGIPEPILMDLKYDLVSVGAFNDFKQFSWVVDIVHQLKKTHSSIKACMIGSGPEWKNIQAKIEALELSDSIELKGALPHHECLKIMMASKALLHPSSFEGASTVILEALYYRCFVISITVPHENMPVTFHSVETKEEMQNRTCTVLSGPRNETSYCVNTSKNSAKRLMSCFD